MFKKINFLALTIKNSSISGNETLHFSVKAQKIKKPTPRNISRKRSLEKTSYIFSKESFFLHFEKENSKNASHISGNGSSEKASYILGSNFPSSKNKKDF